MVTYLKRVERGSKAILGQLYLGSQLVCVTLEDAPGQGRGPVPAGSYLLSLSYSDRFKALLPELVDVPGRTGIRIHAGNSEVDTTGCILVGQHKVSDHEIGQSRLALGSFLKRWREWDRQLIVIEESS